MVWKAEAPQGNESAKVRFDILRYCRMRAVDIGCGNDKIFDSFLGVDNCIDNQLFGQKIKPDLQVATAEDLPLFTDGAFDTVYSSHTLEHIVDHKRALAEWWRITSVGGYLILYLPHADLYPRIGQPGANPDHKHDFLPDDIVSAMREVGVSGWELCEKQTRDDGNEYSFLLVFRKRDDAQFVETWDRPPPANTLAIVRFGAHGDALWISSVLPYLKAQGHHITLYTQEAGEETLRHDPNIDQFVVIPEAMFKNVSLVGFSVHLKYRFDRVLNMVGSVETRLLPTPNDFEFWWPDEVRRRVMDENYLESVHRWAGVPFQRPRNMLTETERRMLALEWGEKFYPVGGGGPPLPHAPRVRFYPTDDERQRAWERRAEMPGPVVVINPSGSGGFKAYPWWPELARQIAAQGAHVVVLGDHAFVGDAAKDLPELVHVVGRDWGSIREALAFAQVADLVIGSESAIANSVAFEPMLKIIMLSHSTEQNLTRDWTETVTMAVDGLDCYPCHRIHHSQQTCSVAKGTKAAACMASYKPEQIAQVVAQYLAHLAAQPKPERVAA